MRETLKTGGFIVVRSSLLIFSIRCDATVLNFIVTAVIELDPQSPPPPPPSPVPVMDTPIPGHSSEIRILRGNTAVETKATSKVNRTRVKRVLIYSKIENATLCSLPWTQVANFFSEGTTLL